MRKIQLCLCCLLTILISNGCSSKKDTVTLEKYSMTSTSLGFDTVVMFTAYAKDEHTYKQYEQILQDEFKRYDKLFDKYHNYDGINNIKTINDHAGDKPIKVDEPIMELLKQSKEYDALSNHQFSVTMRAKPLKKIQRTQPSLLRKPCNRQTPIRDGNMLNWMKKQAQSILTIHIHSLMLAQLPTDMLLKK